MTDVFIEPTPPADFRQGFILRSTYDPGVVAAIKMVPRYERSYDPSDKTWFVDEFSIYPLIEHLELAGHRVIRDGAKPEPRKATDDADADGWATETARAFIETIPVERRGKVFRAMTKQLYPDVFVSDR